MLIINETTLNYKLIGIMIDSFLKENKGSTFYYGKSTACIWIIDSKKYKFETYQLKRYTKVLVAEVK